MTASPADRLLAAAELLDKRADAAERQVRGYGPGEYYWGATYSAIQSDGMGGEIGDYAATMHPEVGKALAVAFRDAGDTILRNVEERMPRGLPIVQVTASLLDLADLVLAGAE